MLAQPARVGSSLSHVAHRRLRRIRLDGRSCSPSLAAPRVEVARFYRRIGGHLALLTDWERPTSIREPRRRRRAADADRPGDPLPPAYSLVRAPTPVPRGSIERLQNRCSGVGLLPERTTLGSTGADVDLSGLGARGNQISPDRTPCWTESGTDAMRLERRRTMIAARRALPGVEREDGRFQRLHR